MIILRKHTAKYSVQIEIHFEMILFFEKSEKGNNCLHIHAIK